MEENVVLKQLDQIQHIKDEYKKQWETLNALFDQRSAEQIINYIGHRIGTYLVIKRKAVRRIERNKRYN